MEWVVGGLIAVVWGVGLLVWYDKGCEAEEVMARWEKVKQERERERQERDGRIAAALGRYR